MVSARIWLKLRMGSCFHIGSQRFKSVTVHHNTKIASKTVRAISPVFKNYFLFEPDVCSNPLWSILNALFLEYHFIAVCHSNHSFYWRQREPSIGSNLPHHGRLFISGQAEKYLDPLVTVDFILVLQTYRTFRRIYTRWNKNFTKAPNVWAKPLLVN